MTGGSWQGPVGTSCGNVSGNLTDVVRSPGYLGPALDYNDSNLLAALANVTLHVATVENYPGNGGPMFTVGLAPDDRVTRLCVHGIIGQVVHHVHARPVIHLLWPDIETTPANLDETASHLADFSIAALKGLRRRNKAVARKH